MREREEQPDSGVAGRSARREYERRKDRARLRGGPRPRLLAALLGPTAKEKRRAAEDRHWATGARGEELLAASLTSRCPNVLLLHDRRLPGGRANIDHIAIAASGVYVIDAKRYSGKIEVLKPLFGPPKLRIAAQARRGADAAARRNRGRSRRLRCGRTRAWLPVLRHARGHPRRRRAPTSEDAQDQRMSAVLPATAGQAIEQSGSRDVRARSRHTRRARQALAGRIGARPAIWARGAGRRREALRRRTRHWTAHAGR